MSLQELDLTATLGTAKTATTNPDPNTLSTISPYPTPFTNPWDTASAWTTQTSTKCKALFPVGTKDGSGEIPIKLHFVPSTAGATFTATIWFFDKITTTWSKPYSGASVAYTGETIDYIDNPGDDPIWLQLSSISAGTLSIYFDGSVARAL